MTRPKTANEKEFNKVVKSYGLKAFTPKEFDEDVALKVAFEHYEKSKEDKEKNENKDRRFLFISPSSVLYRDYLEEKSAKEYDKLVDKLMESEEIKKTQELFELTRPILEISNSIYYAIATAGCLSFIEDNEPIDDYTLFNKIEKWHIVRKMIDKIKPFIQDRFPRWEKATRKEKDGFVEDIKKNICAFKKLGVEAEEFDLLLSFLEFSTALNKIKTFKIKYLLELELPYVNSEKIAEKIRLLAKLKIC